MPWVEIFAEGSFGRQRISPPPPERESTGERVDTEMGWVCRSLQAWWATFCVNPWLSGSLDSGKAIRIQAQWAGRKRRKGEI